MMHSSLIHWLHEALADNCHLLFQEFENAMGGILKKTSEQQQQPQQQQRKRSPTTQRRSSFEQSSRQKRAAGIRWDEENLHLTSIDRGTRQKIDEPKTPYVYSATTPEATSSAEALQNGVELPHMELGEGLLSNALAHAAISQSSSTSLHQNHSTHWDDSSVTNTTYGSSADSNGNDSSSDEEDEEVKGTKIRDLNYLNIHSI